MNFFFVTTSFSWLKLFLSHCKLAWKSFGSGSFYTNTFFGDYGNEFFKKFFSTGTRVSSVAPRHVNCVAYMERFSIFFYLDCISCGISSKMFNSFARLQESKFSDFF